MSDTMPIYLLSIQGMLASPGLEDSRTLHNGTAGAPDNVAAAKSLGDLSHMVYVPLDTNGSESGAFLILDVWNSLDGLNQFFANPQVQEQAGQIFSQRDPVVWQPAEGFFSYQLPSPMGKNERYVGVVRGKLHSEEEGRRVHNALAGKFVNKARSRGNLSHHAYLRMSPPGTPVEFFAVDVWMDAAGMAQHYGDPDFTSAFGELFAEMPSASVWTHPAGTWIEW
jgi:quinol monooxygenase YgiN